MNVTSLRKSGELEKAYRLAKENLEGNQDKVEAVRDMGWVLYDYLKKHTQSDKAEAFLKVMRAIGKLNHGLLDLVFFQQMAYVTGTFLFHFKRSPHPNVQVVEELFQEVEEMPFPKPDPSYSFLLKGFLGFWEDWPGFIGLLRWWGWDHFMEEDFLQQKQEKKVFMSLVEQTVGRYSKVLIRNTEGRELPTVVLGKLSLELLSFMDKQEKKCSGYSFFPYYRAKVLALQGDVKQARTYFLPFAKKKTKEFWVWELLGQLEENAELAFACKVRALAVKTKPEFLVKLREHMIAPILEVDADWAKVELDRVVQLREKKGWPLGKHLVQLKEEGWYGKAKTISTGAYYKKYVDMANQSLLGEANRVRVLVYGVLEGKGKAFGIDAQRTPYKLSGVGERLKMGKVYGLTYRPAPNGWVMVEGALEEELGDFSSFIEVKRGMFTSRDGQEFGFVKDVFVSPAMVNRHGLRSGMQVEVSSGPSYDTKKGTWGKQAFEIEILGEQSKG
ncbi:DUF7017 domain-containing protein [Pleomorphovibrio marinus]|uniref:DUF7017 domain-containing protein n=1 Tax=Pleomorphovibrio marinus TaxID=2164132 RepID=UPI000E0C1A20|nr:hypothetical protein [Pleomorphovibrio marinus]